MSGMSENARTRFTELYESIDKNLTYVKAQADKDLDIDEFELDKAMLDTPKLYGKWLTMFTDETVNLKQLYGLKEEVKLERWKYYNGKQSSEYIAKNGIIHESILKSDIDKYLAADVKMIAVNDAITLQKALVDFIEKTLKEIGNRGFHIKTIVEWRKFTAGGY